MTITVLVPALNRPDRVQWMAASFRENSTVATRIVWLVTADDQATIDACVAEGVDYAVMPFPLAGGDYARKINHGVALTVEPWLLQAGDDLMFHRGWDETLLTFADQHPAAQVIGTNDLGNPSVKSGVHSTHSLIARSYIEEQGTIDEPGKALHEGYWHCWVDNELVETAKSRRAYFSCRRARVEHLHHIWRKGENDPTYKRGQFRYHEDRALFESRRPLWRSR